METSQKDLASIGLKIEVLSKQIGTIAKDGHNTHMGFDFVSSEAMMTALRGSLADGNLSILPSVLSYEERESTDSKGRQVIRSIVSMRFQIIDLETGFSLEELFVGAEQDTAGKSMQQAITQCTKYFYFKLFKVSSKEEMDGDGAIVESQSKSNRVTGGSVSGSASDLDPEGNPKIWLNPSNEKWSAVVLWLSKDIAGRLPQVRDRYKVSKENGSKLEAEAKLLLVN